MRLAHLSCALGLWAALGCTALVQRHADDSGAGVDGSADGGDGTTTGGAGGTGATGGIDGRDAGNQGVEGGVPELNHPCEDAGCHPNAVCSVVAGDALCECRSPYVGTGVTCNLDAGCAALDCGEGSRCVVENDMRTCECLSGFEADGGACVNIDECQDTSLCGDDASCVDEDGSYSCACDADFAPATSGLCERIDDCASEPCVRGRCTDIVADFACECPTGWGGKTCDVDDCEVTDCDSNETCITGPACVATCGLSNNCALGEECSAADDCSVGACASGECHPACSTSCDANAACVDDNDCASDYCDHPPGQLTGVCRPACAQGSACNVADACTRTADCAEGTCTGGVCQPACGSSCTPGSECASSLNCVGADICDTTEQRCVTSCAGDRTLTSAADFTNARYCWQIDGNLTVSPSFATVDTDDLPYLTEVTGSLSVGGFESVEVTLPRLERVPGYLVSSNTLLRRLYLPNLNQVGSFLSTGAGIEIAASSVTIVSMPALTRVYGSLGIGSVPDLATIRLDSLATVAGDLLILGVASGNLITTLELGSLDDRSDISGSITLEQLPNIPWSALSAFVLPLNGNEGVISVGCNTVSACNCGNTSCVPAP